MKIESKPKYYFSYIMLAKVQKLDSTTCSRVGKNGTLPFDIGNEKRRTYAKRNFVTLTRTTNTFPFGPILLPLGLLVLCT